MSDLKAALAAMRALRMEAGRRKLAATRAGGDEPETKTEAKKEEAPTGGESVAELGELLEEFEPYKPFRPRPVSEKMEIVAAAPSRSNMAKAVEAVEAPPKRGPGRPPKARA